MKSHTTFSALLEAFFTERLMAQRQASPHTIAAYRDTFRLLLRYVQQRLKRRPSDVELKDIDVFLLVDFLDDLEKNRGNGARSRNARLAAIRSFFHYVSFDPEHTGLAQRILAIPSKKWHRPLVGFLSTAEVDALLAAPNHQTRSGRRDHALLLLAVQTGLRVSELASLKCGDVSYGNGGHVRCFGKGRKQRCVPLAKETSTVLRAWLRERNGQPTDPLFPNARGEALSRDGVQYILKKCVRLAQEGCPSLKKKRISPHVLRHTTAVNLLQSGVDQSVIALWLGHESIETTQVYLDADLAYKEKVLAKTSPLKGRAGVYRPDDRMMAFLNSL
jgi:site-specific recombinase XerD